MGLPYDARRGGLGSLRRALMQERAAPLAEGRHHGTGKVNLPVDLH